MDSPLVKVNTDPPKKIAELYDIGPALAERIVRYREVHGYFSGPEDLAQIEGIGLELAITLGPHIAWETPDRQESPHRWIQPMIAILGCTAGAVFLWAILRTMSSLRVSLFMSKHRNIQDYLWLWFGVSVLGSNFCGLFTAFVLTAGILSSALRARFFRLAFFTLTAMATAMISGGLALAIYYQFYSPTGWIAFFRSQWNLIMTMFFIELALFVGPVLIIIWRPSLKHSSLLARILNIVSVLLAPIVAWYIWVSRSTFPVWISVAIGIMGFVACVASVHALRTRTPILPALVDYVLSRGPTQGNGTLAWMTWLNSRLPNPEDQKALKRALERAYPTSTWRTVGAAIFFGAGGWLMVTALSAIIEWIIQGWLNQFLFWVK